MTEKFYGTSYGPVRFSPQAYQVIVRFLNQVMDEPVDVEVDTTVELLSSPLRHSLKDLSGALRQGDLRAVTRLRGPDRTFIATTVFGLAGMRIVRTFLRQSVTPPPEAFPSP